MKWAKGDSLLIAAAGASMGVLGVALVHWGNPANSGICISCFVENLAGGLQLHANDRMAYFRPELAGFVLGAFLMAMAGREHRARSGRLPLMGFFLGVFLIVGSSVFMGCPIKMMLRIAAGDLTALGGLAGLGAGVWVGVFYLRAGVDVGGTRAEQGKLQGYLLPLVTFIVFAGWILRPGILTASVTGPGSRHAPVALALMSGLLIGALAQRSRFCVTGSFTNLYLARDAGLMKGLASLLLSAVALSAALGLLRVGVLDQPGSHPDHLWNFLSMAMVGFASVLAGGCPFRQLVLAGEGATDAALVVLGMVVGGGVVHQWGIASTSAGPTPHGKAAVLLGLIFCLAVARAYRRD